MKFKEWQYAERALEIAKELGIKYDREEVLECECDTTRFTSPTGYIFSFCLWADSGVAGSLLKKMFDMNVINVNYWVMAEPPEKRKDYKAFLQGAETIEELQSTGKTWGFLVDDPTIKPVEQSKCLVDLFQCEIESILDKYRDQGLSIAETIGTLEVIKYNTLKDGAE